MIDLSKSNGEQERPEADARLGRGETADLSAAFFAHSAAGDAAAEAKQPSAGASPGISKSSSKFLSTLLTIPSPTGAEGEIQRAVKRRMDRYADQIETDLHGNLMVALNPDAELKVMLAGHCDQIGFMVRHISSDGYIYVHALGGIDSGVVPGSHVTLHTASGPIEGIFGRKPIHKQNAEERKSLKLDLNTMWIDIGARSRSEVEQLVALGDPVTFSLGVTELRNGLIAGAGLDDRVGLFVAMEALRLAARGLSPDVGLYSVSTVQEEIGTRGAETSAFNINPEVGIAIDVTHASDDPGTADRKAVPCVLGGGPVIVRGPNVNPVVFDRLVTAAEAAGVPYQIGLAPGPLGNDARAIQVSRGGVAAASIGIPNRNMHTQVEVCSIDDLVNAARLLARFVQSIDQSSDFRPFKL